MSKSIETIHTSCKNCVFATYQNITQLGCALNYIEKYRKKNVQILEAYDEEKEFYIVNSKKCLGYRENSWFKQYGLDQANIADKISKFKELNYIDYLLILDLNNFDLDSLNKLKYEIQNLEIKPKKIIFVRHQNSKVFPYAIIKSFFDSLEINCKWRIQTMLDSTLSSEQILHNIVNINKGYRFILSINSYAQDINRLIVKANKMVYEDLDSFTVIKNKNESATIFSAPSYRWSIIVEKNNILKDNKNCIII